MKDKIIIKARRLSYSQKAQRHPVIRISSEAYDRLVDLANDSGQPLNNLASEIILQGAELVLFDRED